MSVVMINEDREGALKVTRVDDQHSVATAVCHSTEPTVPHENNAVGLAGFTGPVRSTPPFRPDIVHGAGTRASTRKRFLVPTCQV